MSAAQRSDIQNLEHQVEDVDNPPSRLRAAPEVVEVRRRASLSAALGGVASVVAVLYLQRATQTGAALDWVLTVVMAVLAVYWLRAFIDARVPLLVADAQGVRLRLGRTWSGLRWSAVHHVEHEPRRAWWRDGRLVVQPRNTEKVLSELDPPALRQARLAERLWGAPFALPLGISTRVVGAEGDLTAALASFSEHNDVAVLELDGVDDDLDHLDGVGDPDGVDAARGSTPDAAPDAAHAPDTTDNADTTDDADDTRDRLSAVLPSAVGEASEEAPARDDQVASARENRTSRWSDRIQAMIPRRAAVASEAEGDVAAAARVSDVPAATVVGEVVAPDSERDTAERDSVERDSAERDSAERDSADPGSVDQGSIEAPEATRPIQRPRRVDMVADEQRVEEPPLQGRELRVPGRVTLVEETAARGVTPIATIGDPVEPLVLDEHAAEPAEDPVIGPELAAARTRLGLSVDALAERTRIRPHVIEAIEVDDFEPCGGDFYAKGHLRTLARVLGLAPDPLVGTYEERYSHAPINPRRVFEADLASAGNGALRTSRGGPNWSALVAVVMAVILAWSIARLVMDGPEELRQPPGLDQGTSATTAKVPVAITTGTAGARVVVRDGLGTIVFKGNLPAGSSRKIGLVSGPQITVTGNANDVRPVINGKKRAAIGEAGQRPYKVG